MLPNPMLPQPENVTEVFWVQYASAGMINTVSKKLKYLSNFLWMFFYGV